ncbi:hypothetical protein QWJ07_03955 [Frankia sp. RB7]|nr:hypothetical protein [Frankia sp. RB7]
MSVDVNSQEFKDAVTAAVKTQVDEVAGGLKSKNDELLGEVKGLKEKLKSFDGVDADEYKTLKTEKRTKDDKNSDPVELRQRIEGEFTPKVEAANQRAEAAEGKLKQHIIDSQLTTSLLEAGVAKEFLPAAKALLQSSRKIDVSDSGAVVDGKPVAEFAKTWATSDGKPFIAAADNNGGGSKGGSGGGAAGKKASEMTRAEKSSFIRENGLDAWTEKVNNGS